MAIFLLGIWLGYTINVFLSPVAKREPQWTSEEVQVGVVAGVVIGSLATTVAIGTFLGALAYENLRNRELQNVKMEPERQQWVPAREELERKRILLSWGDLQASSACTKYQTKEYTATLYNVSFGLDPIEECYKKAIEINGHQEKPTLCQCEDRGMCGRITGQFITHNEASCTPHWDRIKYKVASSPHYPIDLSDLTLHIRKGCFHGQRLFHSRLDGLSSDDNWRAVCETTPGTIEGTWFPGPTSCDEWGRHGKWGIWTPKGWTC